MPCTRQPAPGFPRHQAVETGHADPSSNEAHVSRFLKITTAAMLVSAAGGIGLAASPALAGPARIAKITVKRARLDWTPTRTAGETASLRAQTTTSASIQTFTATVH